MRSIFLFLLLTQALIAEVPWGKDASLAFYTPPEEKPCRCKQASPLADAGVCMIRFHQEVISPADGPRSNFIPSSSQYTRDAMDKYGFFKGVTMGCDRLMRENPDPWIYPVTRDPTGKIIKYDPIK